MLEEYRRVPLHERNEAKITELALRYAREYDFNFSGDKYQVLRGFLFNYIDDQIIIK